MGIDYFENIMISLMITNQINATSAVIKTASIFTQMKGGFTTLSWLVILILLFTWLINNWKNKKHTAKNV
jgi:hypothetical protein